jgi:hypothetical protein
MRRHHLLELEDLAWCPRAVRDGGTDWLAFMADATGAFLPAVPKIRAALTATGTDAVVDLCSGGGGPWRTLAPALAASGPVRVTLTDLYPNRQARTGPDGRATGGVVFHPHPIDATQVPAALAGVRTLFNAFHHFPPDRARAILADAVRARQGIAIFEPINHRAAGLLAMPLLLPALALLTPFVRPFRWSRLFLTYAVPLVPLIVLVDGTVSLLRLYAPDELRALVASVPGWRSYVWEIGSLPLYGTRLGPQYVVGVPKG